MSEIEFSGPLRGYRVLELGSTVAGPFCGRMFADFGAEVIKVEPTDGDAIRSIGGQYKGKSLYASSIFRNKSLIAIDLHTVEGQNIVRELASKSDFVVENFKPGTLEKWNLGYPELSEGNPKLIMVRISGYGQTGPYSKRPGYGIICEAVGGLRHLSGDPDRPPTRVAVSLTDYISGLYAFSGALLALSERHRTGLGQYVDAALYECAFSFLEQHIASYQKLGTVAKRMGSGTGSAPNNLYLTKDGQYIHIAANGASVFKRLMHAMECPDLISDARFLSGIARSKNRDAMDRIVSEWAVKYDLEALESFLEKARVPASRIFTIADIFRDPHYRARGAIVEAVDEELGSVAVSAPVPKLGRTPGKIRHSGRRIGQDTHRVLSEILGFSDEQINRLNVDKVVGLDAVPARGKTSIRKGAKNDG